MYNNNILLSSIQYPPFIFTMSPKMKLIPRVKNYFGTLSAAGTNEIHQRKVMSPQNITNAR